MAQAISAPLLAAIKASIADSDKAWAVLDVRETKGVAAVTGTVTGSASGGGTIFSGNGAVSLSGTTTGSTSSTERERTDVSLIAGAVILGAGPMRMRYSEMKVAGVFTEALVEIDGTEYRSTDSALNTTVMGMATTWLTDRDEPLLDALDLEAVDPMALPDDIAASLIASLADADNDWRITSSTRTQFYGGAGGVLRAISMFSPVVRVGGRPTALTMSEQTTRDGMLITSEIMVNGKTYRTRDDDLREAILAKGDAHEATVDADMAETFS